MRRIFIIAASTIVLFAATLFAPEMPAPLVSEEIRFFIESPAPALIPLKNWSRPEITLDGSTESLIWQNIRLDLEGLKRIKNDTELKELVGSGILVPLPLDYCLMTDKELDPKWHFVLLQAARFLEHISETVCPEFNKPLKVNSAVRHEDRQLELISIEKNPNAAPVSGNRASPHLTGAAVDLAILDYPENMVEWLKEILLELEGWGVLDATLEEEYQKVLHVTVFKEYFRIPQSSY